MNAMLERFVYKIFLTSRLHIYFQGSGYPVKASPQSYAAQAIALCPWFNINQNNTHKSGTSGTGYASASVGRVWKVLICHTILCGRNLQYGVVSNEPFPHFIKWQ